MSPSFTEGDNAGYEHDVLPNDEAYSFSCPAGRLALLLALPILFVGAVAAVEAAGGGAEHAMVAGIMAGDAADHGAFQAAFCVGGRCGCKRELWRWRKWRVRVS